MAEKASRVVGPVALGAGAADLYTVPDGKQLIMRHIHVANTTGAPVGFTLSIGADSASHRLWDGLPIPGNGSDDQSGLIPLEAGEKLQGKGDGLTLTISGVLIDL